MSKDLVELTEEEFVNKINESLESLDEQHKYMYSLYIHYLQDKVKNELQCYMQGNKLFYTLKPIEPIGFKLQKKVIKDGNKS